MMKQLKFEPHPGQIRFWNLTREFRRVFCASGRRWGKSDFLDILIWLQWMRMQWTLPNSNDPFQWPRKILLVAPQDDQLDIIFDKVAGWSNDFGIPLSIDRKSKGQKQLRTKWGSVFRGMTGKNPRAGRGYAWQWVFADEAPHVDYARKLYYEVLFPTMADSRGNFVGIGTPDAPGTMSHSWKLMGEDPTNKEWGFLAEASENNWHIPWIKEEIQSMIDAGVPEDIIRREWYGEFVPRAGAVWPEAHRCIMDSAEIKDVASLLFSHGVWYRMIDFGFSNPFACLIVCKLGETWYIWNEYYRARRHLQQHIPILKQMDSKYNFAVNVCDVAEPGSIRQLASWRDERGNRLGGNWVMSAEKPPVIDSIDSVRAKMGMNQVRIHPRCKHLITEYGTEVYPEARAMMNFSENPIDANNHGTSAFRYGNWFVFGNVCRADSLGISGGKLESDAILEGY